MELAGMLKGGPATDHGLELWGVRSLVPSCGSSWMPHRSRASPQLSPNGSGLPFLF